MLVLLLPSASFGQTAQEWRDSLSVLQAAVGRNPRSVDLRLRKAEANINLGQWEYASEEYGRVLKIDPRNLAALYFRAFAYDQLRRYDLSLRDYESFLTLAPVNFEARMGLAHAYQKLGRRTDATDCLNRLVEMFPDSAAAYAARAAFEAERGQHEVALYDWEEALRRQPSNVGYIVSAVDVLLTLGRKEQARRRLDEVVSAGIVARPALREWYERCK